MPGITNPAEEYFKDGLWGYVTTVWKKLVATAGGALHIQFAGQEADVEVTQTAAADLTPGVCGWIGSAWQKLPMLFGYSDRWVQRVTDTAGGAGHAVAAVTAVDAGYVYVLQSISVYHDAAAVNQVFVTIITTGDDHIIYDKLEVTPGEFQVIQCEHVLKYQDYVEATAVAPGGGKMVIFSVWGYKMKIAE